MRTEHRYSECRDIFFETTVYNITTEFILNHVWNEREWVHDIENVLNER